MDLAGKKFPKILVFGCGRIAREHARNLRGKASLFFASKSASSARRISEEFNGDCSFSDYEKGAEFCDAIVLSSPPDNRLVPILVAARLGKPILVEKPLCLSEKELLQIERICSKARKRFFLQVAENWAYKKAASLALKLVCEGKIGNVKRISCIRGRRLKVSGWREKYGALLEGGIHQVALVSSLAGGLAPKRVSATFGLERPERESIVKLGYGKFSAELEYSWNRNLFGRTIVFGSLGRIVLDDLCISATLISKKGLGFFPVGLSDPFGTKAVIDNFLFCLKTGKMPYYGIKRAKTDMGIVFSAYKGL